MWWTWKDLEIDQACVIMTKCLIESSWKDRGFFWFTIWDVSAYGLLSSLLLGLWWCSLSCQVHVTEKTAHLMIARKEVGAESQYPFKYTLQMTYFLPMRTQLLWWTGEQSFSPWALGRPFIHIYFLFEIFFSFAYDDITSFWMPFHFHVFLKTFPLRMLVSPSLPVATCPLRTTGFHIHNFTHSMWIRILY